MRRRSVACAAFAPAGELAAAGVAFLQAALFVLISYGFVFLLQFPDPEHSLGSFRSTRREKLEKGDTQLQPDTSLPVICLGDSLTRGNLSADWVALLRQGLSASGRTVLNAGTNMHCAHNVCRRLDEVIDCGPSHVIVLIGTNDLKGELSPVEGFSYCLLNFLAEPPSLAAYEQDLLEIRERLLAVGTRVAFASPPVLGELVASPENRRAAAYAAVVRRVALGGDQSRCRYLPLYEKTLLSLPTAGGEPYDGVRFFVWMWTMCFDMYVLGRPIAEVQKSRGLSATVDLVHLGPAAAEELAAMANDFVDIADPSARGVSAAS